MSARSALVAVVVTAVLAFSATSSTAADQGHTGAQDAMDTAVREDGAPGVLGEAADGGGVWHGAAGVADRRTKRPRLPHDRFRIGSLTKPFVATVLLQLESERRLDLDDPVARWLPGLVRGNGYDGRRITVRQLLGHTSGIHDFVTDSRFDRAYFGRGFLRHRYDPQRPAGLVRTALAHRPSFAPGTGFRYSNTNYVLAGMVIEKVTGRSYATEIRRRLIRPLGLRDTSLPGTSARMPGPHGRAYSRLPAGGGVGGGVDMRTGRAGKGVGQAGGAGRAGDARLAAGRAAGRAYDVTALDPSFAGASGEMVSSTGDLLRFFRALLSERLLPPRQSAEMRSTVPAGGGSRYGLGLTERRLSCGTRIWEHEGDIHGSRSVAAGTPDGTHTAVFNVNADWTRDTDELVEAEYCRS